MIWWQKLIDIVLPRSSELKALEELSVSEFYRKVQKSDERIEKNIITILNYKDPLVRTAIWQIKYRNHQKISRMLAKILHMELLGELADLSQFAYFTAPILIPIPLSPARHRSRGYNQTENLATAILKIDGGRNFELLTKTLIKIKETPPQSSLSRALRLQNLHGSFQVKNPEKIRDRNLILIDDVTTTGATLLEASSVLYRAGARKVITIAVAH